MGYVPRIAETAVDQALSWARVVVIAGPRQSGKSTLARRTLPNALWRTLDDPATRAAAAADPVAFVQVPAQLVIDEVHRVPDLLLAIKRAVDEDPTPGRFLLTGSAHVLSLPQVQDTLAGRIAVVELGPFTQAEIDGTGIDPIDRMFASGRPDDRDDLDRAELHDRLQRGGFPEPVLGAPPARWYREYARTMVRRDVETFAEILKRDEMTSLTRILAAQTGGLLKVASLARDVGLSPAAVERYLSLLRLAYLTLELPAWRRAVARRGIGTPKGHLIDPALAIWMSGGARRLADASVGGVIETFVVTELWRHLHGWSHDASLSHLRTKDGIEVDAVIERGDGAIVGVEVKSALTITERDFRGLRLLSELAGDDFVRGVLLYRGGRTLRFGDRIEAWPMSSLWS